MADIYLHQLPDSAPLTGAEFVLVDQGGDALKTTAQDIANLAVIAVGPPGPAGPAGPAGPGGPAVITIGTTTVAPPGGNGNDVLFQDNANLVQKVGSVAAGDLLMSQGATFAPVWSAYIPAVPGNWAGAPPSLVWATAIDRLAAWIAANNAVFTALGITTAP